MNNVFHTLKVVRAIVTAFVYVATFISIPVAAVLIAVSEPSVMASVASAAVSADISPCFYGFNGAPTEAYKVLQKTFPVAPKYLIPALNTPALKECAVQYAFGALHQMQTGDAGKYPSDTTVAVAFDDAKMAIAGAMSNDGLQLSDLQWNGVTATMQTAISRKLLVMDKSLVFRRIHSTTISTRSLVMHLGIAWIFGFIVISLCSKSMKKGMKRFGAALQFGGVLTVIVPAVACFFISRFAVHTVSDLLYYGRYFMSIFQPVVKIVGLVGILAIVSGAVLENRGARLLKEDSETYSSSRTDDN